MLRSPAAIVELPLAYACVTPSMTASDVITVTATAPPARAKVSGATSASELPLTST